MTTVIPSPRVSFTVLKISSGLICPFFIFGGAGNAASTSSGVFFGENHGSRSGMPLKCARMAFKAAFASAAIYPSAFAILLISALSASIWTSFFPRSTRPPISITLLPSLAPAEIIRSHSSIAAFASFPAIMPMSPRSYGSDPGTVPMPIRVWHTHEPVKRASMISSSSAPDCLIPPPQMIRGFRALSIMLQTFSTSFGSTF